MYGLDKVLHSHLVYTVYVNFSEIFRILILLSIATCWSQAEIRMYEECMKNVTSVDVFFRYISDKTPIKTFCKYSYL